MDGSLIVATHNVNNAEGMFSVFNYGVPTANLTFTAPSSGGTSYPFGAVGYCYEPLSGCYPGGEGNSNDLFMWNADTPRTAVEAGPGRLFAFQLPIWNPFNITEPKVFILGNTTMFQSPNPPVFANKCYSMYMSVTRSEIRYWSSTGKPRDYFDKGATVTFAWERGYPRFIGAAVPPTLSSNPTQPFVYGPSAAAQLFRMSFDFSDVKNVTTPNSLTNKVLLSPDEKYVYYANSGFLYQLDASSLKTIWNVTIGTGAGIFGEIAQSIDGAFIYIPNAHGKIYSIQVKSQPIVPTTSPTVTSDVIVESEAPISAPIPAPTSPKVPAPVKPSGRTPTVKPTSVPVSKPIVIPTNATVSGTCSIPLFPLLGIVVFTTMVAFA
jgi:hypothetical protein